MRPEVKMSAAASSCAAVVRRGYFFGEHATGVISIGPIALRVKGKTGVSSAAFSV